LQNSHVSLIRLFSILLVCLIYPSYVYKTEEIVSVLIGFRSNRRLTGYKGRHKTCILQSLANNVSSIKQQLSGDFLTTIIYDDN